ncbi:MULTISPECIES: hypothetical protein [Aeromonas]|uniref:hypothetical protein n=1 Tax=Aeromonas TaxID=642 RepID=UPI0020B40E78|nr:MULTISPECIES: hypothetical protein [Aeromonas]MCX4043716.1 hypothetical protein [Aeromonas veronii]
MDKGLRLEMEQKGVEWHFIFEGHSMPNYHFFTLGQALTYLDANAPRYSDERRQLVEQGFAAMAAPIFADTPVEALALLRQHQAWKEEAMVDALSLTVATGPTLVSCLQENPLSAS